MKDSEHSIFLEKALHLAQENIKLGGGPFGAVVVKDGEIIAAMGNMVFLNNDPTAHAEISAIRAAAEKLGTYDLSGCLLYSSCEPCPMCLAAVYWSGIKEIFYANTREEAADAGFDDLYIYRELAKDKEERDIRMKRINLPDAGKAFEEWKGMENKNEY